ncbi:MAG TPA: gamma-glutamyltransferase [Myxococcota bacterium]|jgi:gamma-glutamyltranspeptidase/glutathione hydrolase
MAATAHPLATAAALEILADGGNAVDAAVAATFAVSVVEPFSAGIGGGGFAVVYLEGKDAKTSAASRTFTLDFRETAPAGASRDMYLDPSTHQVNPNASVDGHLAVAVPGTVAGMAELHKKYGKLPWRRVLEPAIAIARDGYVVTEPFVNAVTRRKDLLAKYPGSRAVFMKKTKSGEQVPLELGDKLVQHDLANTLKEIAKDPKSFYTGRVADLIDDDMKKNAGVLSKADLAGYQPQWREPLCAPYEGYELCTMPPPSSGGVHVLEILNLLSGTDWKALGWHQPDVVQKMIEAMRIAYADRAVHLGDPAFTKVPVKELISKAYADSRRKEIDPAKAKKSADVKAATPEALAAIAAQLAAHPESTDTTHLTVVDKERNAVSLTFTVNLGFGSGVVVPGTGVLLNDEMDDFSAAPNAPNRYGLTGGEANSIQPHKIPLSSMTPLIATKDGHFFMTAGSPGGSTIITTVLQTVLHVIDYGMDAQAAVSAPRIHHQWLPDSVTVEKFGLDDATAKILTARGDELVYRDGGWGNAMCIVQRPDGTLEGGADPRGEGVAKGP